MREQTEQRVIAQDKPRKRLGRKNTHTKKKQCQTTTLEGSVNDCNIKTTGRGVMFKSYLPPNLHPVVRYCSRKHTT